MKKLITFAILAGSLAVANVANANVPAEPGSDNNLKLGSIDLRLPATPEKPIYQFGADGKSLLDNGIGLQSSSISERVENYSRQVENYSYHLGSKAEHRSSYPRGGEYGFDSERI